MSQYEEDWFGPKPGLLAADVPLPPRRPPNLGDVDSESADLPTRPPGRAYQKRADQFFAEQRQRGLNRFNELKQDYPLGSGYPETAPSFPSGPMDPTISGLNRALGGPYPPAMDENVDLWPKRPLPPEYEPQRPIPLGEIQRKWGVPRLEDL